MTVYIKAGDKVLSKNDKTGEKGYKSVVRLFRGHTDRVVTLRLTSSTKISKHRQRGRSQRGPASRRSNYAKASSGSSDSDGSGSSDSDPDPDLSGTEASQAETQEIRCTTEHPFWVVGRGWVPAGELRDGDELVGEHEESLFVESARIDKEEADHYNFEVEDWHTYFVGEDGNGLGPAVWAHNICNPKLISNKFPSETLPTDGVIFGEVVVKDGKIAAETFSSINGTRVRDLDFVITTDRRLLVGRRHHFLGNRDSVFAAGQIRTNGQGAIRRIDNLSGHYRPTVAEALQFPELLTDFGLQLRGSTFEIHSIVANSKGYILPGGLNLERRMIFQ